jgi:hypothetical protein
MKGPAGDGCKKKVKKWNTIFFGSSDNMVEKG